jgi:peptidoglycan L-alanyl-D-glutamate endopeptidase CwlK
MKRGASAPYRPEFDVSDVDPLIREVQRTLGTVVDGAPGPATWAAIYERLLGKSWGYGSGEPTYTQVSKRSSDVIKTLLDEVQPYAETLYHVARTEGIVVEIVNGFRSESDQQKLYDDEVEWRRQVDQAERNGVILPFDTEILHDYAKPGESLHEFGLAFDVGVFEDNQLLLKSPLYSVVGVLGRGLGLVWGGELLSNVNAGHFECNLKGYDPETLRARRAAGLSVLR